MKRKLIGVFILSLLIVMASALPSPAPNPPPPPSCPEGCTPGYWKNHLEAWAGLYIPATDGIPAIPLTPMTRLDSVFTSLGGDDLGSRTLLEALEFNGGSGVVGAARILLRQAVAGLLNAAHPGVNWIVGPEYIWYLQYLVNEALSDGDRSAILLLAGRFEGYNELLCPL